MATFLYIVAGFYLVGAGLSLYITRRLLKKRDMWEGMLEDHSSTIVLLTLFSWVGLISVVVGHAMATADEFELEMEKEEIKRMKQEKYFEDNNLVN